MVMSLPPRKKFTTSRGYAYSFIHIPSQDHKLTIFLIHGWPSHIDDWIYQIRYFESQGYGLLVPDTLGYGGSSNPADPKAYRLKPMSQDLIELLDHVHLPKVVGIGHDWGATILSRLILYHSDRFYASAFLGVGPPKPSTRFDLDIVNQTTKMATGIERFGYMTYIVRDPNAQHMMEVHAESFMDIVFAADPKMWDLHFHPIGGMKKFVEAGQGQEVAAWFTPELQRRHLETFGRKNGYLGPSNYYKMLTENLSVPDEKGFEDFRIPHQVVFVASKEPASAAVMQMRMLSAWVPHLKVTTVDAGHWVHMERSAETNRAIEELLERL
ncbi:Alpha/Beta hydrolase protein [Pseudomassariella vexata]|uniref:Alpha/Beta hydrolase protein n=1 Tax=Pseudomassariella vexata TaxID=1141098 RepID=A0A1Y2DH03_9PEZI|nr:Alpha/Beta hydrolase protein [Pseudomassariella vexata]ORY58539.1 Alpha/Beta hydrolase protein [Pseudomassariella vexata]